MPHKGDSFIEARRILARQSVLLGGSHDRLRKRLVENSSPLSPLRNLASNFLQLVEWRGKSLDRSRSVHFGKESVRGCCSDGGGVLRSVNRPVGTGYPGPFDGGDRMAVLRRR